MKLTWFKTSVDILTDQKMRRLKRMDNGYRHFYCWIAILCLAMKSDKAGFVVPGEFSTGIDEDLSIEADLSLDEAKTSLDAIKKLGMVSEMPDGSLEVVNFTKYQDLERIEYRRLQSRERKRRQRASIRQKIDELSRGTTSGTPPGTHAGVTPIKSKSKTESEIESKKENEEEKNVPPPEKTKNLPYEDIRAEWNWKTENGIPQVEVISKDREDKIRKRLSEGIDFPRVIEAINKSDFLRGANKNGWVATFDWVIANSSNWLKIIEGAYDNRQGVDDSKEGKKQDMIKRILMKAEMNDKKAEVVT